MPGVRLSSVQNLPAPAGRRRITAISEQPEATRHEALAAFCAEAGCLVSSVCSCLYIQLDFGHTHPPESTLGPNCPCCEV